LIRETSRCGRIIAFGQCFCFLVHITVFFLIRRDSSIKDSQSHKTRSDPLHFHSFRLAVHRFDSLPTVRGLSDHISLGPPGLLFPFERSIQLCIVYAAISQVGNLDISTVRRDTRVHLVSNNLYFIFLHTGWLVLQ